MDLSKIESMPGVIEALENAEINALKKAILAKWFAGLNSAERRKAEDLAAVMFDLGVVKGVLTLVREIAKRLGAPEKQIAEIINEIKHRDKPFDGTRDGSPGVDHRENGDITRVE